ncbi:MAG TPA: acyl-CoA dehydrogenase family protein [Acidimicrobiales bacterium]|nr:acyl-CoA dehydrogenase family protein [Acidimicrobiales bacterium]
MKLDLGPELESFRDEVRSFLNANKNDELAGVDERLAFMAEQAEDSPARAEAWAQWEKALAAERLICPHWPEAVGGRGLTGVHMAVLNEEFSRAGMPRVVRGMGETLVGPSIIVHGTEEQKAYFLPRIIDGTDRYCQGFSEPDHGSDLGGVETRGVIDGDEVVITGQKVWTSGAHRANMIFILCRTDPDVPKHRGLSYVLVPMQRDGTDNGIELHPLRQMSGASGFCQEFIEGARAPLFNVIGGLNNGWRVAMTTLGNERGGQATTQHLRYQREFWDLVETARKVGRNDDPLVRQDLAWAYAQVEIMRFSGLRLLATLAAKREPGPEASVSKLFWSEYHKRLGEIAMNLVGAEAMIRPDGDGYRTDRWQQAFLGSRAGTIFSGTSQIQRNIIGERALGLPKEPAAPGQA